MRKLLFISASFMLTAPAAHADYFQVFDGSTPYYVPYAQIRLKERLLGYTDAYGRIRIDLPPGHYSAQVLLRDSRKKTISLALDGSRQLKRVDARDL
jgi:hypothetical protein